MEIENVKNAVDVLEKSKEFAALIPEVHTNIVMVPEDAKTIKEIVGIPGRITVVNGMAKAFMKPDYMSSSHMARLVLSVMKHDPNKRSAMNIKYNTTILEICEKLGLQISSYNRSYEPEDIKRVEGSTIEWGVETAIEKTGEVPDVIYHKGAWGKEPMICLIGSDALEVAEMADCIAKLLDVRTVKQTQIPTNTEVQCENKGHEVIFAPSRGYWKDKNVEDACIFCAIAEGNPDVEEMVLYNDKENMVLMNIFPYSKGHLEVIPLNHYTNLNQLNGEEIKNLFRLVQRSISLIKEVINPEGINIGINLGKAAGASIEHLHIHLVPRFTYESGFMETTASTRVIEEDINVTYAKFYEKLDILRNDHEI